MKNILNPKWIFLINTFPVIIVLFLSMGEYSIFKSLLKEENSKVWKYFGSALVILAILTFLYAYRLIKKNKEVTWIFGVVSLVAYTSFLYLYGFYINTITPFFLPDWMEPNKVSMYVGTFLMPTLIYSLFVVIVHLTPVEREHKAWKNFVGALAIPLSLYLFVQLILPHWRHVETKFTIHATIIAVITITLVFLFLLARGVYVIALRKSKIWSKYELVWKIPIAIIFPLLGLAINNGHIFHSLRFSGSGLFGNFSNSWFYVLAIVNGLLICFPNLENRRYRIFLFIGRCIMFSYTMYFFLVFLPFLPLSVMAVVALGTGFLMLTPLVLFVIHVSELTKDFHFLVQSFSKSSMKLITTMAIIVIPFIITILYAHDKYVLNKALDYVYSPDYSKEYKVDKNSLFKTLAVVKDHKGSSRSGFAFGGQLPYLSSYFNWLVLDNLTLSDSKIKTLEKVFYGTPSFDLVDEDIRNNGVMITKLISSCKYDKQQKVWKSWVNFEITNTNKEGWNSEYATTIELPVGCWISDYYLYVGEKKEMGILAEKKSAMWIFSQIRNTNRDPGILYYLSGNKVAFRVFPFAAKEVRKSGIEFIHKEPVQLNFDKFAVVLGDTLRQAVETIEEADKNLIYVSKSAKSKLNKVQRKPYYHILVDASEGTGKHQEKYAQRIDRLLAANHIDSANAKISFVNTYSNTFSVCDDWKKKLSEQDLEGGFFLDKAIRTILFNAYKEQKDSYPIIVVITNNIGKAIVHKDFADFKMAFPESDLFYTLNETGDLIPHSLVSNPLKPIVGLKFSSFNQSVRAFPVGNNSFYYLSDNNEQDIVIKKVLFEIEENDIKEKSWNTAFVMNGVWLSQVLHPEKRDDVWLDLVRDSFISKVMNPFTSYLVVENDAQKAVLQRKQEQVLSGKESLDTSDDAQRMSEPGLMVTLLLTIVLYVYMERRKLNLVKYRPRM